MNPVNPSTSAAASEASLFTSVTPSPPTGGSAKASRGPGSFDCPVSPYLDAPVEIQRNRRATFVVGFRSVPYVLVVAGQQHGGRPG